MTRPCIGEPPSRLPAADRYGRDPKFHELVDTLYLMIRESQYTPTELREAVMLAAWMFESRHMRSFYVEPQPESPKALWETL
jgi:hypothetical protein